MKFENKITLGVIIFLGLLLIGLATYHRVTIDKLNSVETLQSDTIRVSDTLVIYDTIRIKEPKPYYAEVVRTDTLIINDTVKIPIPIEQKTYQNEDYKAVIQGYNPTLLSMDLYKRETLIRDTLKINNTITKLKPPRWTISVGPGIGYGPKGVEPYIGINAGFVIWSK